MIRVPVAIAAPFRRFARQEDGAATVDWVIVTAGATGAALVALEIAGGAVTGYTSGVRNEVQSPYFDTSWTSTLEIPPQEYWEDREPIVPASEELIQTGIFDDIIDPDAPADPDDDPTDPLDPTAPTDPTDPTIPDDDDDPVATGPSCPDGTQTGTPIAATGAQLWNIFTFNNFTAGGDVSLADCNALPGVGFVNSAPAYSFNVSSMQGYNRLEIETRGSNCDTVLLVRDPSGNWYSDDNSGDGWLNAEVNVPNNPVLSGRVDIWVGTKTGANCNVTLEVETW